MGFLSWLFPKPADRIAKAKRYMTDARFAEARLEVMGLDHPEAESIRVDAEHELVKLNLEKAVQRGRAGDRSQVQGHIDLAESFHDGSLQDLFDEARTQLDALGEAEALDAVWENLTATAARREQLGVDPGDFTLSAYSGEGAVRLFFGGDRPFNLPGLEYEPRKEWFRPDWLADTFQDEDALLAAIKTVYPAALEASIDSVVEELVAAMTCQGRERPELAVKILLDLPRDNPVVAYELGRASAALGCHRAAGLAFDAARTSFGQALTVGGLSLAFWSILCALWSGELESAKSMLEDLDDTTMDRRLVAAVAIESGQLERAALTLDAMPEDDPEKPQLAGAFHLRTALHSVLAEFPVIDDPSARGTEEWNDALEIVAARLQDELDAVIDTLQQADGEGAEPDANYEDFAETDDLRGENEHQESNPPDGGEAV